jgi:hypothetical protein
MPNAYLEAARDEIAHAVEGLTAAQIAREVPGRWSIAQILEHLTLAFTLNAAYLQKALASGELRGRRPNLKARLIRMLMLDVDYFPRAEAPEPTRPSGTIPPEQMMDAIRTALTRLDATLTRVSERFGDSALVANHPYFMGLTVPQWRKFHWRHAVHHMRQVKDRRTLG